MTTPLPPNEMPQQEVTAPAYGSARLEAMGGVVFGIADDLTQKINAIRASLNRIEQQALQSAAAAKVALADHVAICARLNDEILHTTEVVTDIQDKMGLIR